jgi:hypothetical protein
VRERERGRSVVAPGIRPRRSAVLDGGRVIHRGARKVVVASVPLELHDGDRRCRGFHASSLTKRPRTPNQGEEPCHVSVVLDALYYT